MSELAKTPLHAWHASRGARLVDFGGWSMPVQYSSIVEEHQAARTKAALFDVSHMGRLSFSGEGVATFLDHLLTRNVAAMKEGAVSYSLICNEQGGVLDDVLVYYLAGEYSLVVNAGNREKIVAWISDHTVPPDPVQLTDRTAETAMIAVQGPLALQCVQPLISEIQLENIKYYTCRHTTVAGANCLISRTGYTGEDGVELSVPAGVAEEVWTSILKNGEGKGVVPAGLGARDTLRLEAAMPLYGHELTESIDPLEAGLGFAVDLEKPFVGRDALAARKADSSRPRRVGLQLAEKRVPREGYAVSVNGSRVGEVTSGTFSPTLNHPIAMAYVSPAASAVGTKCTVDIRGKPAEATVVKLPFYKRPK